MLQHIAVSDQSSAVFLVFVNSRTLMVCEKSKPETLLGFDHLQLYAEALAAFCNSMHRTVVHVGSITVADRCEEVVRI